MCATLVSEKEEIAEEVKIWASKVVEKSKMSNSWFPQYRTVALARCAEESIDKA